MRLPALTEEQRSQILKRLEDSFSKQELAVILADNKFEDLRAEGYTLRDADRNSDRNLRQNLIFSHQKLVSLTYSCLRVINTCDSILDGIWLHPKGIHKLWMAK